MKSRIIPRTENGEDTEDGQVDENSVEFVQDLANKLVGNESRNQFTDNWEPK